VSVAPANPELIRNIRAQLRADRVVTVAVVCAVLSLAVGYSMAYTHGGPGRVWGLEFLRVALAAQTFVLVLGGGLVSLLAVQREKELNTFDFQRVTRLRPLELALGKLFGAPVLMYFIVLCLMPAALVGAAVGHARPTFVVAAYVVAVLGAISIHALALLLSLLLERGVAVAGGVLFLIVLWLNPLVAARFWLDLGSLSPFYASDLSTQMTWAVMSRPPGTIIYVPGGYGMTDVLFGWPVHHAVVAVALYAGFAAWFLLAVVRNIKRDPAGYEIFTPAQALGFLLFINLIFIGFFRWSRWSAAEAQADLLGLNTTLCFVLGVALLRTRDRVRRLDARRRLSSGWLAAAWPAPYLAAGTLLVGLVPVAILQVIGKLDGEWDLGVALFRVALFSAWLLRDVLYLQWMNLRLGGRLRLGLLYLAVFYICTGIVFGTLNLFGTPSGLAFTAVFMPPAVFALRLGEWAYTWEVWLAALGAQILIAGLFVSLQRRTLADLSLPGRASAAAAGAA